MTNSEYKTGHFNTARQYSDNGQPINFKYKTVYVDEFWGFETEILFHDTARGIWAGIKTNIDYDNAHAVETALIKGYDQNRHYPITTSDYENA